MMWWPRFVLCYCLERLSSRCNSVTFAKRRLCLSFFRSFRKVKFFISGANMPGEGELKCLDWVRTNCAAGTEESVVIVGNDSDLLVQALGLPKVCSVTHSDEFPGHDYSSAIICVVLDTVLLMQNISCWKVSILRIACMCRANLFIHILRLLFEGPVGVK